MMKRTRCVGGGINTLMQCKRASTITSRWCECCIIKRRREREDRRILTPVDRKLAPRGRDPQHRARWAKDYARNAVHALNYEYLTKVLSKDVVDIVLGYYGKLE